MAARRKITANRRNRRARRGQTLTYLRRLRRSSLHNRSWQGSNSPRTRQRMARSMRNKFKHGVRVSLAINVRRQPARLVRQLRTQVRVRPRVRVSDVSGSQDTYSPPLTADLYNAILDHLEQMEIPARIRAEGIADPELRLLAIALADAPGSLVNELPMRGDTRTGIDSEVDPQFPGIQDGVIRRAIAELDEQGCIYRDEALSQKFRDAIYRISTDASRNLDSTEQSRQHSVIALAESKEFTTNTPHPGVDPVDEHVEEYQTPALKKSERQTLCALGMFDASILASASDVAEEMEPADRLSTRTIHPAIARLVELDLAERPEGDRRGVRLTIKGRRLASKIAD